MIFTSVVTILLSATAALAQQPTNTILQNVVALGEQTAKPYTLKTLGQLASGYDDIVATLGANGEKTLFAPTDAAFQKLNQSMPDLFGKVVADKELLKNVLLYHVIPGTSFNPANAPPKSFPITANAPNAIQVIVAKDPTAVTLNFDQGNATVVDSVPSSNGVIHVVDSILLPPRSVVDVAVASGLTSLVKTVKDAGVENVVAGLSNFTLFAPTNAAFDTVISFAKSQNLNLTPAVLANILKFHIVPGQYFSTDIIAAKSVQPATALDGQKLDVKLDGNTVTVTGPGNVAFKLSPAKVVMPDVIVKGGVVHVVDAVLLPDLNAGSKNATDSAAGSTNVSSGAKMNMGVEKMIVATAAIVGVVMGLF